MIEKKGPCLEKLDSISNEDLKKFSEIKLKDNKLKSAFKEIIFCLLFVSLTMTVSYQTLDYNSLSYRRNLMNLFGAGIINNAFDHV